MTNTDARKPNDLQVVVIMFAVFLSLLVVAGVLANRIISGKQSSTTTTPILGDVVSTDSVPATTPVTYPALAADDQLVVTWNFANEQNIRIILSNLSAPPNSDLDILRINCRQVLSAVEYLLKAESPPYPDLVEKFAKWLDILQETATLCTTATLDDNTLQLIFNGYSVSGNAWADFYSTLATYVNVNPPTTPVSTP